MQTISAREQLRRIHDKLDAARRRYISLDAVYDHTPIQEEIRRRIQVAVWAYAYEIHHESMVSDDVYDKVAREIDPKVETYHAVYDKFFREEFSPSTGMWVRNFPTPEYLEVYYQAWKKFSQPLRLVTNG